MCLGLPVSVPSLGFVSRHAWALQQFVDAEALLQWIGPGAQPSAGRPGPSEGGLQEWVALQQAGWMQQQQQQQRSLLAPAWWQTQQVPQGHCFYAAAVGLPPSPSCL